jgi:hypothetical protein
MQDVLMLKHVVHGQWFQLCFKALQITVLWGVTVVQFGRQEVTPVPTYQTMRRHIPEDSNFHSHRHQNLRFIVFQFTHLHTTSQK